MFRLVLIHQLVLSLIVGPALCCCTTAPSGHGAGHPSKSGSPREKSQRKQCCGELPKSPDRGQHNPADGPSKCPCKDHLAKVSAVSEIPVGTGNGSDLLSTPSLIFGAQPFVGQIAAALVSATRFNDRSSSVSTADLLYAHHNLRC